MKRCKLPDTDSIEELAEFWDTHDLTDFQQDLQEVEGLVFVRANGMGLSVELRPTEARQLKKIARSQGIKETTVLRRWIVERLHKSVVTSRGPTGTGAAGDGQKRAAPGRPSR